MAYKAQAQAFKEARQVSIDARKEKMQVWCCLNVPFRMVSARMGGIVLEEACQELSRPCRNSWGVCRAFVGCMSVIGGVSASVSLIAWPSPSCSHEQAHQLWVVE